MPVAMFSDKLKDKERGDEKQYFGKQDAKLLASLLKKIETQSNDSVEADTVVRSEKELQAICKKFSVPYSEGLARELLDWKYEAWSSIKMENWMSKLIHSFNLN